MALADIQGIHRDVLAREAQRPGGLDRLLAGQVIERSDEADETAHALRVALDEFDVHLRRAADEVERARGAGVRLTTVLDDDYPPNLRVAPRLPPFLFYRGTLRRQDDRAVAVVGTAPRTVDGIEHASRTARTLAENGVTVVVAATDAIGTAALEAALAVGGRTIAVLDAGIVFVEEHVGQELAARIELQGAVVSDLWPTAPERAAADRVARVVISGLSQMTILVGAAPRPMTATETERPPTRSLLVRDPVAAGSVDGTVHEAGDATTASELRDVEEVIARLRDTGRLDGSPAPVGGSHGTPNAAERPSVVVDGQLLPLQGGRVTVGKGLDNDIVIQDPTVSRIHAVIERVANGHTVVDVGSRNGTHVNGERVFGHHRLRPGDEIRLGKARLIYNVTSHDGTETAPVEPAPTVTARERDVLVELCRPLASGTVFTEPATATHIARRLFVTEAAVRMHLSRLYRKFGIDADAQDRRGRLATSAIDRGAITTADLTS